MEVIATVFVVLATTGIVLGAINAVFGVLCGLGSDFFGFLPMGVTSIGFALAIFGASGLLMMSNGVPPILALIVSTLISISMFIGLTNLKKRMKSSNPVVINNDSLVGKEGIMLTNIHGDDIGLVSLTDSVGASITYKVKMHSSEKCVSIIIGQRVLVVEYEESTGICYVVVQ